MSISLDIMIDSCRLCANLTSLLYGLLAFLLGEIGILNWEDEEEGEEGVYITIFAFSILPLATYLLWYGRDDEEFAE
jgi:hypothetical protein